VGLGPNILTASSMVSYLSISVTFPCDMVAAGLELRDLRKMRTACEGSVRDYVSVARALELFLGANRNRSGWYRLPI